jgi:DNA-binding NarL/FixJ family response regulator
MATVRILLVDDFAPFRSYVRCILEEHPEWEVIGEAADGAAALRMVAELEPDLILLDIGMPTLNGIEVAQQVGTMVQRSKILFLSSHCSQDLARLAMATGAMAYVVKWDAGRDLPRAIRAVMENKWFVSNRLSGYGLPGPT